MKQIPFTKDQIEDLIKKFPTPFYIYDESGIRNAIRSLHENFLWNTGFKEYFPVKATPNPAIINILREEDSNADCCSVPELIMAKGVGFKKEQIMLTSNDTGPEEFIMAKQMENIINLDDPNHLEYLEELTGLPNIICARYNPGPIERDGRIILEHLIDEKFGMRKDQLLATYELARKKGIKRFGLHMMIVSNDLESKHIISSARICFDMAAEIRKVTGIELEFIDLGGGVGIPYRPDQTAVDMKFVSEKIRAIYEEKVSVGEIAPCKIFIESGRLITGPHGYLVTKVRHIKESHKLFAGVDASMADLMRPGMYGSYHHISVLDKEESNLSNVYDVVGSMCENNDKFAINRELPSLEQGDIMVIHDVGAYGRGKVFNFNGKLRPAEFLLKKDGSFQQIRRAETVEDYFETFSNWENSTLKTL